jgi:hypothetical protein
MQSLSVMVCQKNTSTSKGSLVNARKKMGQANQISTQTLIGRLSCLRTLTGIAFCSQEMTSHHQDNPEYRFSAFTHGKQDSTLASKDNEKNLTATFNGMSPLAPSEMPGAANRNPAKLESPHILIEQTSTDLLMFHSSDA